MVDIGTGTGNRLRDRSISGSADLSKISSCRYLGNVRSLRCTGSISTERIIDEHISDFADEFPDAQIIGTDISPIQPSWVPANLQL